MSTPDQPGQPGICTSAKLNLARVSSTWQPQTAVELYGEMQREGHLGGRAEALLGYAHALAASGQLHQAADTLNVAKEAAASSEVSSLHS